MSEPYHWPDGGPIEDATFVSHDGCKTWVPLCDKCRSELTPAFTPWRSHLCSGCGWQYLIWAEDWPDYDAESE